MTQKSDCTCKDAKTIDEDVAALGRQMRFLARTLHEFMDQDLTDEGARSKTRDMAEVFARIIGGRPVTPGAFEECCLVGNSSAGGFLNRWFCTGTLIHPRVVVSADHCIGRTSGNLEPNSIAIGIDDEDSVTPDDILRVARIHKHPTEDIALLVLQSPATVAPITLAETDDVANAKRVELVGFGNTDPTGTMGFGEKRQVNVAMNVVRKNPNQDLSEAESTLGFDSHTEFVAGRKGSGRDSCNGDSGGPAYVYVNNERKLAGATSRATDEANDACGDGGVYVRVDSVKSWIDGIVTAL